MYFKDICKEFKEILKEDMQVTKLPLRNYAVFVCHCGNIVDRLYYETKSEAMKQAKSMELKPEYYVKVLERGAYADGGSTNCFAKNRGFDKLLWSSCKGKNESLVRDVAMTAAAFNPLTALAAKGAPQIQNTARNVADTVKKVSNKLTSDAWQALKRKKTK